MESSRWEHFQVQAAQRLPRANWSVQQSRVVDFLSQTDHDSFGDGQHKQLSQRTHSSKEAGSSKCVWIFVFSVASVGRSRLVGLSMGGGLVSIWIVTYRSSQQNDHRKAVRQGRQ